ncbi:membrane dipeptidase [Chlamydia sp. 17-3921]|uniref:membrane dipeptidase n=1 Tax=Chlamydia sp. 17-3921 TaxID=2675798 RepID=UPI001918F975|nr:membrane dipeptidase [Chlamydia sp. 17-3921]
MIIDIHGDLLSHPTFSSCDPAVRCSPEQLRLGGVKKQVCALFVSHNEDNPSFAQQNQLFFSLPEQDPHVVLATYENFRPLTILERPYLAIIRSLENASGLGSDNQPLQELFTYLIQLIKEGPIAYLSLVWNWKNRFGGGALEPGKLSCDGKNLLDLMNQLAIPVDLSHCSDKLTEDILDYTLNKLPNLKILASHSNFRSVANHPRNLLDAHAKEIAARGGIIGLNVVKAFVGESLNDLRLHLFHAEKLGILSSLVLGTDFFYATKDEDKFFIECGSAADHPKIHQIIQEHTSVESSQEILFKKAEDFLNQVIVSQANMEAES